MPKTPHCESCSKPAPGINTLRKWMNDGVAKAIDGCKVEPDGSCPHDKVSWLIHLEYI